ncbi:hypothetical protein J1N35_004898 [Gossypium stocksii]|uniref:Uncharacterized protein n=1 Tax=Gossypium stocksii TaxID=47602 RepID=A0A9D3WDL6_9ROSI|nr:hypothetical protein J1N35_004898 [Gossypium stocksii]
MLLTQAVEYPQLMLDLSHRYFKKDPFTRNSVKDVHHIPQYDDDDDHDDIPPAEQDPPPTSSSTLPSTLPLSNGMSAAILGVITSLSKEFRGFRT